VTAHDLVLWILVGLGVAGELLCCLGLVVMKDIYARLHYAMAASTVPPFFVAAAVIVERGWTQPAINALLLAAALFLLGPIAAHTVARAARSRRQ
jgi:monovalent cation/proton antiporter MnhG/PhaG subunit